MRMVFCISIVTQLGVGHVFPGQIDPPVQVTDQQSAIEFMKTKGASFYHSKASTALEQDRWSIHLRTKVADGDLKHLKWVTPIRFIGIFGTSISDQGVEALAEISALRSITIDGARAITAQGIDKLADIRSLERLKLNGLQITNAGLKRIDQLVNLTELDLQHSSITDEALETISKLDRLEVLFLVNTQITDAGVRKLARLPKLQKLYLNETGITNDTVKSLVPMKELETLGLGMTKVDDDGLKYCRDFPKLASIGIRDISDQGLKNLQGSKLKTLSFVSDKVTDEGLRYLAEIKTLKILIMSAPQTTPRGVAELKAALPGLNMGGLK